MLKQLISEKYGGNQAEFSRKAGFKSSQVSRWLSETAADKRNITEQSARDIEVKANISLGYLDGSKEYFAELTKDQIEWLAMEKGLSDKQRKYLFYIGSSLAKQKKSRSRSK